MSFLALKTSWGFLMCHVGIDMVRSIVTAETPEWATSTTMNLHLSAHSPDSEIPTAILSTTPHTPAIIPIFSASGFATC